ncbi:MAG: DUF5714 domain-containing protein, partial [Bacilli bacterium]|nr:DUF5714 domain-containing protein [Bacilli bacterium]
LSTEEKDPIAIVKFIMHKEFMSIHGPEHHFLDGGAMLVAMHNSGLSFDLGIALTEFARRSSMMPGAMCGYWGVCGSVSSLGAAFSVIDKTGPLSNTEDYASHMEYTSSVVSKMSKIGGPRCCKRNAFLSLSMAIDYANKRYGLSLPKQEIKCEFSEQNIQCIGAKCPFNI